MKRILLLVIVCGLLSWNTLQAVDYHAQREQMVRRQIAGRGVSDTRVLAAMRRVPRHLFVPEAQRAYAYQDRPLPIGYGQTISQPYIVALMTELLQPQPGHRILEIGTGSGYQAAVLSHLVGSVYTVEIVADLHKRSKTVLTSLYKHVHTLHADGYHGWAAHGPYDGIIVTCAPSFVPPPLIKQLKTGGRLVIPVGPPFSTQKLLCITKTGPDTVKTEVITQVIFVPLRRASR